MHISIITGSLVNEIASKFDSTIIPNNFPLDYSFDSPYPLSPVNLKEGKTYVVTQGAIQMNTTIEVLAGSIIHIPNKEFRKSLAQFLNKELGNFTPVVILRGVKNDGFNLDSTIVYVDLEDLRKSKCTLELLDELLIDGEKLPNTFVGSGYLKPLTLLLGDVSYYHDGREDGDIRIKYSLTPDLKVQADYQLYDNNDWETFNSQVILAELDTCNDSIYLASYFEYKDNVCERLEREVEDKVELKELCKEVFMYVDKDVIKNSGVSMQEVADYVLTEIGYCCVHTLLDKVRNGGLNQQTLRDIRKENKIT